MRHGMGMLWKGTAHSETGMCVCVIRQLAYGIGHSLPFLVGLVLSPGRKLEPCPVRVTVNVRQVDVSDEPKIDPCGIDAARAVNHFANASPRRGGRHEHADRVAEYVG